MRRAIALVVAAMLLALLVPLSAVSANDSHESGSGNGNKITVCHNIEHHAVTIQISKKAWSAHKRHGDTLGACVPRPVKPPKGNPTTASVCTFSAPTSVYNNGGSSTSPLYATGPIRFSWTVASGVVSATGGFCNEMTPVPPATPVTYFNNVTGGTVSAGGAVSLSFVRTFPDANSFSFGGTLAGNVLTGTMAGNYFTATGTTTCTGNPTTASVCTFSAPTSVYNNGATSASPLYATGPIRFSWTVATGVVSATGGYWNEMTPIASPVTYFNNVTSGSVSAGGAVSLSFVRTLPDSNSFSFGGTLAGNVLTGLMAGNYFTATGTTTCTGNPTTASVCTFSAPNSAAYSDTSNTSALYATGPIRFSWNVVSGAVATTGGFWNELFPPVTGTTFVANVTGGTVSTGGIVSLSFVRPSDSATLSFSGTLTGNVLTGQMSAHYFTATGTLSCTGSGDRDKD